MWKSTENHWSKTSRREDIAKRISLARTGEKQSKETIEKRVRKLIGKKRTPEMKKRLSIALTGNKNCLGKKNTLGLKHTLETREKMRVSHLGKNTKNKDGVPVSPLNVIIRGSLEYKLWREAVFKRDNYTCIWCKVRGNETGGYLNADHILPFSQFPEWRFEINNGRTLCVPCHRNTKTYGNRLLVKRKILKLLK